MKFAVLCGICLLSLSVFADVMIEDLELDGLSKASVSDKQECDMVEFQRFVDDNIASCEVKVNEKYDPNDSCANVAYVELRTFLKELKQEDKKVLCQQAIEFCIKPEPKEYREMLWSIVRPDCAKKAKFYVNKDECSQYAFKKKI